MCIFVYCSKNLLVLYQALIKKMLSSTKLEFKALDVIEIFYL